MKKSILPFFLALALCLSLLPAPALAADSDFVISNGVLMEYRGEGGHVTIPSTVHTVRGFGGYQNKTITSVTIPSSVTTIEGGFQGLYALEEITIPDSVTWIESYAFQDCPKLKSVRLPSHLDFLGGHAFADCPVLTDVRLPQSVDYMEGGVFDETPFEAVQGEFAMLGDILYAYNGKGENVVVPQGVTQIACKFEDDFAKESNILSITIPEGVTDINMAAFTSCVSLKSVSLPSTLKKLSSGAFWGCTSLESVVLPAGLTVLEDQMFWGCTNLKEVTIPASVTSIDSLCFVSGSEYISGEGMRGIPLTGITIHGAAGSAAERLANGMSYTFVNDQPTGDTAPQSGVALANTQAVTILNTQYNDALEAYEVVSTQVTFYCYALTDENGGVVNYVKLRDVAQAINGTVRNFNVGWDGSTGTITLSDGEYEANGSELKDTFGGKDHAYGVSMAAVSMRGIPVVLDGITLVDENGGASNYFKLRDLGRVLDFDVSWYAGQGIVIDTWNTYTDVH